MRESWVSLKLAVTQASRPWTMANSGWPTCTSWPTSTFFFDTAPASGIVSKKNVEVGQLVQVGQPLFAIVQGHDAWVTANFKETQLSRMRPGETAEIEIDAYPGATF